MKQGKSAIETKPCAQSVMNQIREVIKSMIVIPPSIPPPLLPCQGASSTPTNRRQIAYLAVGSLVYAGIPAIFCSLLCPLSGARERLVDRQIVKVVVAHGVAYFSSEVRFGRIDQSREQHDRIRIGLFDVVSDCNQGVADRLEFAEIVIVVSVDASCDRGDDVIHCVCHIKSISDRVVECKAIEQVQGDFVRDRNGVSIDEENVGFVSISDEVIDRSGDQVGGGVKVGEIASQFVGIIIVGNAERDVIDAGGKFS